MTDPWYAEMGRANREKQEREVLNLRLSRVPATDVVPPSGPPPEDCSECYEWRFDVRQSDGTDRWMWFQVCPRECSHAHHEGEVWLAC